MKSSLELPQIVPSSTCVKCEVCCRFPDPDSALRPYFTSEDIDSAISGGLESGSFLDRRGSSVALIPDRGGDGYLCPAFDQSTSHCTIYDRRPFDCRIYPLALMWNEAHDQVLLGWDTKCPFLRERVPREIERHAAEVKALLDHPEAIQRLGAHPRLIGRYQEDVIVLASLPRITAEIESRWGTIGLHQFTVNDLQRLELALTRSLENRPSRLAAHSVAYHYMWNSLLAYWWVQLHGAFCLFVQSPDGWFMPLPPLETDSVEQPLAEAFEWMQRWNGDSPVSRVDNVSLHMAPVFERLGYRLKPREADYVYRATDLTELAGDRYKSQRALCNRVEREQVVHIEPYQIRDRVGCRLILEEWSQQKRAEELQEFDRMLLSDAKRAHEVLWSHAPVLKLLGHVVRIGGRIRAYTFGYWLDKVTFCVLVEVADRTIPGLAQYLFRHTCRQAVAQGAEFINTMDDAGLTGLRASKQAYHPSTRVENFTAARA
jgi:Fe-S-cluster containining protein